MNRVGLSADQRVIIDMWPGIARQLHVSTAGFASLCTEVNTLSRNNQSTLTVFDTIFRKLLLYAFALLRFWNMLYERKRCPWTPKMAGEEVRLREQLRPESTSRVAIPASSAPQRALAPAM